MLYALLAALVAVNAGYLFLLDRKDRRFDEQVSRLLQRIQAPDQAVLEHSVMTSPKREGPAFENEFSEDEAHLEDIRLGTGEY